MGTLGWIIFIIIIIGAIYIYFRVKKGLGIFVGDINRLANICEAQGACTPNGPTTPACKACLNANAPGVVKAGGSL